MSVKKVLCILSVLCFTITLCFSGIITAGAGDVDIDLGENGGMVTYQVPTIAANYKTQGRTSIINGGLSLDYTASSFEFNAALPNGGNVVLNVTTSNIPSDVGQGLYFTVVVDGVTKSRDSYLIKTNGDTTLTLATGLTSGSHSFAVYRQTEIERGSVFIKSITFSLGGTLLQKPADKNLFVEFVGDSLTTGYGNLTTTAVTGSSIPSASAPIYQDGTKAFAYLTAKKLDCDYSIVAQQGIGAYVGYQPHNTYDEYPYTRYIRDKLTLWDFARQPDVVVITLGGNDAGTYIGKGKTVEDLKTGFSALLNLVKSKNPNAKIVWANRTGLAASVVSVIQTVIADAGGENSGYYFKLLSLDYNGGNSHPTAASDDVAAGELKTFIQTTVLGLHTPGDINGSGSVDLADVTVLSRHVAGWQGLTIVDDALDVNGDKEVDLADVTILSRYVAGWNVTLQ